MPLRQISTALLLLLLSCTVYADAGDDFAALMAEEWEARLAYDPVFASELGDRRYNQQWEDLSLGAIKTYQDQSRDFLRRTYAIDKSALNDTDQLDYELFRRTLQSRVDAFQFKGHLLPLHHRGGAQNLENTANRLNFESVKDYEDWLARMNKIDDYIEQTIDLAEAGRKQGYMPPKILMQRIPD